MDDVPCLEQRSVVRQREMDGDEGGAARGEGGKAVDAAAEVIRHFRGQGIKEPVGIALRLVPQTISSLCGFVQLERTAKRRQRSRVRLRDVELPLYSVANIGRQIGRQQLIRSEMKEIECQIAVSRRK